MKTNTGHLKTILNTLLAALLLTALFACLPAGAATIIKEDLCGDGSSSVTYTLDDEGLLTISGTGAIGGMDSPGYRDWHDVWLKNGVRKVVIGEGVTEIGDSAFVGCETLTEVLLPDSMVTIWGAFENTSLTQLHLPRNVSFSFLILYIIMFSLSAPSRWTLTILILRLWTGSCSAKTGKRWYSIRTGSRIHPTPFPTEWKRLVLPLFKTETWKTLRFRKA